jgi:hypothetical protein
MRAESWIFAICTVFFVLVAPAYWLIARDPTGTSALIMTALLTMLVTFYLGFHASKMEPRPEDLQEGEIADGAGELGFFPPFSWWPMWCALTLATIVFAVAFTEWWLVLVGFGLGTLALCGWIYEYYTGEHAH